MVPKTAIPEEKEIETNKNEQRFNRQINFFLMRQMWHILKKKKKVKSDNVYKVFDMMVDDVFSETDGKISLKMSRERYTRAINTGRIIVTEKEQKQWESKTDICREIFTGKIRFKCIDPEEKRIELITGDDWENLFKLREARQAAYTKMHDSKEIVIKRLRDSKNADIRIKAPIEIKKFKANLKNYTNANAAIEIKEFKADLKDYENARAAYLANEKSINERLSKIDREDKDNWNFYALNYYFEHTKSVSQDQDNINKINAIEENLDSISFAMLDDCDQELLIKLQKTMINKLKLTKSIVNYRDASEKKE